MVIALVYFSSDLRSTLIGVLVRYWGFLQHNCAFATHTPPPGTDFIFQAHSWFGELYTVETSYILSYLCLYYIIALMGFIYRSFMFILEFSSHYLFLVSS